MIDAKADAQVPKYVPVDAKVAAADNYDYDQNQDYDANAQPAYDEN